MTEKSRRPRGRKTIQTAKRELSRRLLRNPGVSGVGIEGGDSSGERIKVYLAEEDPTIRALVPTVVAGYPVVVEVVGRIVPRAGAA